MTPSEEVDKKGMVNPPAMEVLPYKGKFPGPYVPGSDWRIWLKRFENTLSLRKVTEENDKRLIFLDEIGPENYMVLETLFPGKELEKESYETLTKVMTARFKPKVLLLSERYRMMKIVRKPNQSLVEYMTEIQNAAKTCEFEKVTNVRDLMVTMTFIAGLDSEETRRRMMEQPDKGSAEILELAEAFERVGTGAKEVRPSSGTGVHEVEQVDNLPTHKRKGEGVRKNVHPKSVKGRDEKKKGYGKHSRHQGKHSQHKSQKRTYFCHICKQKGHSTERCKFNGKREGKTHNVTFEEPESFEMCKVQRKRPLPKCRVEAVVDGKPVTFELDTGACMSIIGRQTWESLGSPPLSQPDTEASSYDGTPLSFKGMWVTPVSWEGTTKNLCIYVMDKVAGSLWGRDAINLFNMNLGPVYADGIHAVEVPCKLDLARRVEKILSDNKEVFHKELGKCTTAKAALKFKVENPEPKFFRARPVPYAIKPKVDEVLDRMVQEGSLKAVDHAEWATPLVVVPKPNGKVRLCGDFKITVNPVLDINQYPLPKPEDMFHQLNGGQKFSKIDLKDAYTQVELEEESKRYLVLNTQKGLFQYQRLPFGVASAPAIFQKIMEQTLAGIPGVLCYLDDVTITAASDEEHLQRLDRVLSRLKETGFRLSREKCAFLVERMEFLGHVVDKEGIRPSPEKVRAMLAMPAPVNTKQVEAFIGMVNYYGKFIPNLSTLAAPLNALRRKDTPFTWEIEQQSAFEQIRKRLADADILAHYDPQIPVILATDASEYGIGAVIYHKYADNTEKVIAYASRSLTKAERNYAQIEKEALGIVYGVEKFSQFLYGRKFTLLTDHQPLVRIFGPKNELPVIAAKRLHRWALKLMMYVFEIEYRNTLEFGNADGLSRLPRTDELPSVGAVRQEDEVTRWARENLSVLPFTREDLIRETERDPILQKVRQMIRDGFPEKVREAELKCYAARKEELCEQDGYILCTGRVVVPMRLQDTVLKLLHQNHYGKARMKALARLKVWFPEMNKGIEQMAKACEVCAVLGHKLTRTPLHLWEPPDKPWQRVHIDFCGPAEGSLWMVVVDAGSKWPEAIKMKNIKAETTVRELSTLFATHGIPEQVVSDNGPQLTSSVFEDYCKANNIEHLLTPPYHPNSNGEAERFVQTFKRILEKGTRGGGETEMVVNNLLLQYRCTPHPATGKSPAMMLMGRQLRMPMEAVPAMVTEESRPGHNERYRDGIQKWYNKKSRVREFTVGERVYILNPKETGDRWLHAIIVAVLGSNRYEVNYGFGQRQCHANQMKKKEVRWEQYEARWKAQVGRKQTTASKATKIVNPPVPRKQKEQGAPVEPLELRRSARPTKPPEKFVAEPASSRGGSRRH